MSQKKKEPAPRMKEEPVPPLPAITLARSAALRHVVQVLANGAHTMHTARPFMPHTGLASQLLVAYSAGNIESFLTVIQHYLEQAVTQIPQAGKAEEIPAIIEGLRELIARPEIGLILVGQKLFPAMNAL